MHPAQHQAGTARKTTEICFASGKNSLRPNGKLKNKDQPRTSGENSQDTEAGKQYHQQHPTQGKQIITAFLTRITGTTNNRDRQGSMRSKIDNIPPTILPLHLHSLQDPDMLSHSIVQLAETQLCSLKIFAAEQKSQIDVYQEPTRSNKEKEHDTLFTSIPVFNGDHTQCEQWLDNMDQATRIRGHDKEPS